MMHNILSNSNLKNSKMKMLCSSQRNFVNLIFLLSVLVAAISGYGNSCNAQHIQYTYDENGNRSLRSYSPTRMRSPVLEFDSTLSKENHIEIFPNPVKNIINVSILDLGEVFAILNLSDENGRILEVKTQVTTQFEFDISKYKAGVYYLIVWIDKKSTSFKILKM